MIVVAVENILAVFAAFFYNIVEIQNHLAQYVNDIETHIGDNIFL